MKRLLCIVGVTLFVAGYQTSSLASQSSGDQVPAHLVQNDRLPALRLRNAEIRDILTFIGDAAYVFVKYDQNIPQLTTKYSVNMTDVTVEDALTQILGANGLAFRITGPAAIFVFVDSPENQKRYSVSIQNFYIQNADPQRIFQLIADSVLKDPTGIRPIIQVNRNARTIDVRATGDKMAAIAKLIADNDKR